MLLVCLYGPPAVGKLTVARELSGLCGFPVFHNHLIVDAVQAVFPFGSDAFVELRERLWFEVIERAASDNLEGLIFTFAPERTVRPGFAERLRQAVLKADGQLQFIELRCDETELERRVEDPSRMEFGKLNLLDVYQRARDGGAFEFDQLPRDGEAIDTQLLTPVQAAREIATRLGRG